MAGYRLRLRLVTAAIFAFATLFSYSALIHFLPHLDEDAGSDSELPEQPHLRDVDGNQDKNGGASVVHKEDSNEISQIRQNHQENVRECNTTVTILIPSIRPFKAWREYKELLREFSQGFSHTGIRSFHLRCPRQRCDVNLQVTAEEKYLNASDAIIMNMFPNAFKDKLLKFLSHLRQVLHLRIHWFFYGVESPQMMTFWDPNIAKIPYHHSITYHSEADINLPYGKYRPNRPLDQKQGLIISGRSSTKTRDWSANKTALIVWMASNCNNTFWPRYEFVNELSKHVPVDMYGGCGTLTCLPAMSEKCTNLVRRYKFYLSLENAECDEYITEKVWSNGLLQGAVPVVYGGRKEAYQRILPPKSFIHIIDFDSVEHLASYLKILDLNKSMYNMYHAWREQGHVEAVYPPLDPQVFCEIVPFALTPPPKFRTLKDSSYFKGCKSRTGAFAGRGSLKSFVPWE